MDKTMGPSDTYVEKDLPACPILALREIREFFSDRAIEDTLSLKTRVVVPVPSTLM
jgi:hypothetical protein